MTDPAEQLMASLMDDEDLVAEALSDGTLCVHPDPHHTYEYVIEAINEHTPAEIETIEALGPMTLEVRFE